MEYQYDKLSAFIILKIAALISNNIDTFRGSFESKIGSLDYIDRLLLPNPLLKRTKHMKCPKCNSEISNESINIQTDIAQCVHCNNIFKISDTIIESNHVFNVNNTPPGIWIKKDFNSTIIGATTRSPIAFFLVPFIIAWSGLSIGGIYGGQIAKGEFDIFISIFGIPFLMGSLLFGGITLMSIWGKVELTLDNTGGKVFTGIGKMGRTKTFIGIGA